MQVISPSRIMVQIEEHWSPLIVGELNGQVIKLARLKGEFIFHHHDHEDEMFYVLKGSLKIEFPGETKIINEGEFLIIPRGIEHKPVADEEVEIMLFEPASTLNTGNVENERTVSSPKKIEGLK